MSTHSEPDPNRGPTETEAPRIRSVAGSEPAAPRLPNWFVRAVRAMFGYRKTSLTFLVFATLLATVVLSAADNSLEYTVDLPADAFERAVLDYSWSVLQEIGAHEHTYTSRNNDKVHAFLEKEIVGLTGSSAFMEYDNDLNYTNNIMFAVKYLNYDSVSYYESNNLLVRVNGTDDSLPALLLSSHYDSVPSAFGITDDGMGVASMMGLLKYFAAEGTPRPKRTIVFNFNNNEEFGLYGAHSFLKHPWFSQIRYFLNLEGTGAGGKAILFRGTDYGIVKHFSSVRYPFATSLFQQGFNNRLIHSETDYSVYKDKGGIRGLDLAFYKPRDLYHTAGDNIKNVNVKSLWHMLSSALDFTVHVVEDEIDLDRSPQPVKFDDFSAYTSFMNVFFAAPISKIVVLNIALLVVAPIISLLLLIVIFNGRKAWNFNFVNVMKFPLSFVVSVAILSFCFDVFVIPNNVFLANNSIISLAATLFASFLLLNYAILNGINALLGSCKGHQHDEKLIVILETSSLYWVALLWSTIKLSKNRIGNDHTGEFLVPVLFILHSFAAILGLVGWSFKKSLKKQRTGNHDDRQPLLHNVSERQYEAEGVCDIHHEKSFSYDWLIQFLIIVPISSYAIYNSGFLILDGINKSIQESLAAQEMIYKFLKTFAIVWSIPFLPFIFKVNKIMVLVLFVVLVHGLVMVAVRSPFDQSNPLKLRFLETIDLDTSPPSNEISVSGRLSSLVESILRDMPSFKADKSNMTTTDVGDGMLIYSWNSPLHPHLMPNLKLPDQLLSIDVLKNSSSISDAPFGMLTGEIKINVPKNRNCKVDFKISDSLVRIMDGQQSQKSHSPVKSVTVYTDKKPNNKTNFIKGGFAESFSKDANGNYVFKDFEGINQLQLNKLDWDKPYHLGFQWIPDVAENSYHSEILKIDVKKLGVSIECYWSELEYVFSGPGLSLESEFSIPAYDELLHYSPNYVSWANKDRGLVSVKKYVEL
ncbi:putative zinc metalloprotease [Metschnikowia bicuspidata var. bicuspidata NRRL YB-4993]|uniref:Peptide hydrolase n=1 Tax=Metschnikowia bicuspidata var. bicuspidata NRRL YB-4993 TaxID=869754 RepID=A0A1A0H4X5_9ASCO|nr:putative zinc metalloprotease [Metschnikowia bicuspidata var. bicuspidata NRRL YB-4993]OBA19000.1 putative zinc metalloprotease [Metschnikowia bicuspidata var. bicuspidata NRRL YB-4993]